MQTASFGMDLMLLIFLDLLLFEELFVGTCCKQTHLSLKPVYKSISNNYA